MDSSLDPGGRLIVALDFDGRGEALRLVDRLGDAISFYKVGWQLFIGAGFAIVRELAARGMKVFLDVKMGDIDATVSAAVGNMKEEVELLTLQGTGATVRAAREGRRERLRPKLLLVTALSSQDAEDVRGIAADPGLDIDDYAVDRARAGLDAGCDGLIASGTSVGRLRAAFPGREFLMVVPGIRPAGAGTDDHKRTLAPLDAIRDGADYLVVGRPVRNASDPAAAAARIVDDIARGMALRSAAAG